MNPELFIDNFAGGGGASTGIERALGRAVDYAINHNPAALDLHKLNHPDTIHLCEDVWQINPAELCKGRPVGLVWLSPDCKHFSKAKGGKPVEKKIRGLAWVAVRWAKSVRPRIIMLENVEEFQDWGPLLSDNRPDPSRKGLTFRRFVGTLRNLGYNVQWRELVAADYGAPTTRKRLFLIARCDGQPIVWPEPTHSAKPGEPDMFSPALHPWRTAAECIDWSLPCPSIFERRRPLAEATLRRIAMGLKRYVIEAKEPFIVCCNHSGDGFRGQSLQEPMCTITAARDAHGLVIPQLVGIDNKSSGPSSVWPVDSPLRTITLENRFALASAFLKRDFGQSIGQPVDAPAPTATTSNHTSLVTAFLAKHYGGIVGHKPDRPIGTVTSIDHHSVCTAFLSKFYGTNIGSDLRQPLPTITANGQHIAEVRAFLIKYYGCGCGQKLTEPLDTVTTRDRFGLVTIHGIDYQIADIGLRMLTPRELMLAQGFPPSYILTGTKSQQVAMIGNSVCPPLAEALVRANYAEQRQEEATA
jgi:DNA (cytosine-5)-methyltransferase 1